MMVQIQIHINKWMNDQLNYKNNIIIIFLIQIFEFSKKFLKNMHIWVFYLRSKITSSSYKILKKTYNIQN